MSRFALVVGGWPGHEKFEDPVSVTCSDGKIVKYQFHPNITSVAAAKADKSRKKKYQKMIKYIAAQEKPPGSEKKITDVIVNEIYTSRDGGTCKVHYYERKSNIKADPFKFEGDSNSGHTVSGFMEE